MAKRHAVVLLPGYFAGFFTLMDGQRLVRRSRPKSGCGRWRRSRFSARTAGRYREAGKSGSRLRVTKHAHASQHVEHVRTTLGPGLTRTVSSILPAPFTNPAAGGTAPRPSAQPGSAHPCRPARGSVPPPRRAAEFSGSADPSAALLLRHRDGWRARCRCPVVDLSVGGDTPSDVTCDTPSVATAKSLRPGNFKNVIQNIWYPFAMSDTRCSVSNTDRPPRSRPRGRPEPRNPAVSVPRPPGIAARTPGILRATGPLNSAICSTRPVASPFAEEPYRR